MNPLEFFDQKPVFSHEEFKRYAIAQGTKNKNTQKEMLAYHLKKKNIIRIRRGLFASVPLSSRHSANSYLIDPYLIAGRINKNSILAYHTALDLHGVSHSLVNRIIFLSKEKIRPFTFQKTEFISLPFPIPLIRKKKNNIETITIDRQGLDIKVTSLERTIVDILDRPDYAGGWEEIWQSANHISILNVDKMIKYALLLENATTIAKLGFFLEQHKEQFNIDEKALLTLQKKKPNGIHYLERSKRESGKYIKRWNLIVPEQIIKRAWEEPMNDAI
jgi:predicted transcriptional regulator of viral defense system